MNVKKKSLTSWIEISIEFSECSAGSRSGKFSFVSSNLV